MNNGKKETVKLLVHLKLIVIDRIAQKEKLERGSLKGVLVISLRPQVS